MLSVNKLVPQGRGLAGALLRRAASVELDWELRQKSRFEATDSAGRRLGIFLPRGSVVRGGDVLVAEDGSLVVVRAAAQPVLVARHCAEHGSAFDLMRAAYHLGNRHVALELQPDHLKLEPDHVLAQMLRGMHLIVGEAMEAFEPEGGAYAAAGAGHGHGHQHGHDHGHDDHGAADQDRGHEHGHDHGHGHGASVDAAADAAPSRGKALGIPVAATPVAHVHGPGCGHDHGHGHGSDPGHGHDHEH